MIEKRGKTGRTQFTRKMKKTHTIFLPQMLEYHAALLEAAFEGSGYHFKVMRGGCGLKDKSLRYISNDFCYPGILIVGQMLDLLESGEYETDKIAFMEPQAGGACRAGNYYHTIIRTLEKCGQPQVPVISLNYKGLERQPGFRITVPLFLSAVTAVCYGDLIMALYQQVKPYECAKGTADSVKRRLEQKLADEIRHHHGVYRNTGEHRRSTYRYILETFADIPVKGGLKKMVGLTGEIYIKYSSLGNHAIENFLEGQGCQCVIGGFINYAIYVLDSDYSDYLMKSNHPVLDKAYRAALAYLQKIQRELCEEVNRFGRFFFDLPYARLKEKAGAVISYGCRTGDGWLVAAEAVAAIERGCKHILILHPFGCLVSHICERGIVKKLKMKYPDVNIQTIEYDYDSSDTLRESRILLGLSDLTDLSY